MESVEAVTTTLPHLAFLVLASGSTARKQLLAAKSQAKVFLTHTEHCDQDGVPWLGIYYGLNVKCLLHRLRGLKLRGCRTSRR